MNHQSKSSRRNSNSKGRKNCKSRPQKQYHGKNDVDNRDQFYEDNPTKTNDISWYNKYQELLNTAARIPYTLKPGMTRRNVFDVNFNIKQGSQTVEVTQLAQNGLSIPGIWTLDWMPSIGQSQTNRDPASVLAQELYSRVRENYSGTLSVDAPDLFIQVMALDSIFSLIGALKRVYRVLNSATPFNYNFPYGVLQAIGLSKVTSDYFIANKERFRGQINWLINQAKKFVCPSAFDYIKKHYWMNDNLFTDAENQESQIYIFNQKAYYKFNLLKTPQSTTAAPVYAGGLVPNLFKWNQVSTVSDSDPISFVINQVNDCMQSLAAWEECYDINGYFKGAFGDSGAFVVEHLDGTETTELIFDPVVLTQIQNANTAPIAATSDWYSSGTASEFENQDLCSFTNNFGGANFQEQTENSPMIGQDPTTNAVLCYNNFIYYTRDITSGVKLIDTDQMWFNVPLKMTDVDGSVEASRLKAKFVLKKTAPSSGVSTSAYFSVVSGTEIILQNRITYAAIQNIGEYFTFTFLSTMFIDGVNMVTQDAQSVVRILVAEAFDWKPLILVAGVHPTDDITTNLNTWAYFNTDIMQLGTLSVEDFKILNQFCLLSQLNAYDTRTGKFRDTKTR